MSNKKKILKHLSIKLKTIRICNGSQEQLSNSLSSMTGMAEAPSSPLGATDSTEDSDEEEDDEDSDLDDWEPRLLLTFTPHSLCESPPAFLSGLFEVVGLDNGTFCCTLMSVTVLTRA